MDFHENKLHKFNLFEINIQNSGNLVNKTHGISVSPVIRSDIELIITLLYHTIR